MKFKVGDKVRVLSEPYYTNPSNLGKVFEVVEIIPETISEGLYKLSNGITYLESRLEPVEKYKTDAEIMQELIEGRNNKSHSEKLKEPTDPLDLVQRHKRICERLNRVYADKNHDYGNSFGETFEKYGNISALVRISDKMNRIDQLVQTGEQKVKDEALEDSILDMANYLIMWVMELEEEEWVKVQVKRWT